jgi:GNAT superfamily N-acetyltransferase
MSADLEVVAVGPDSPLLVQVVALGRAQNRTLGFFPRGAYLEAALDGRVLATTDGDQVAAYLVYRVTMQRAVVVHLCVAPAYRGRGIAKLLISALSDRVGHLDGIGLWCRSDYPENRLWPRLGFQFVREKPGRSIQRNLLSFWWMDFGRPNLFSAEFLEREPGVDIVLDVCVISVLDTPEETDEVRSLRADWIQSELHVFVTPEARVELNRDSSPLRLAENLRKIDNLDHMSVVPLRFETVLGGLTMELFPGRHFSSLSTNNQSDLRHLAYTIAAGKAFFVTLDRRLLARRGKLGSAFQVTVLRPAELILHLERSTTADKHRPVSIADKELRLTTTSATDTDAILATFLATDLGERRTEFEERFFRVAAHPQHGRIQLVHDGQRMVGLMAVDDSKAGVSEAVLLRVLPGPLSHVVARTMLSMFVYGAARSGRLVTCVSDSLLDAALSQLLPDLGFISGETRSWKCGMLGCISSAELLARLRSEVLPADARAFVDNLIIDVEATGTLGFPSSARLERRLWPARILGVGIPSYLAPIQPQWARELFDTELALEGLFPPNRQLILNHENVYYRSGRGVRPPAGARLIWYVTGQFGGRPVKSVRACSSCDDVVVDSATRVYKSYRRLGIFAWHNVLQAAQGELHRSIMAIRFVRTEEYQNPVPLSQARTVHTTLTGKALSVRSLMPIEEAVFAAIHNQGVQSGGARAPSN